MLLTANYISCRLVPPNKLALTARLLLLIKLFLERRLRLYENQ